MRRIIPYIKQNDRMKYDGKLAGANPLTCGELNYCITNLIHYYLMDSGNLRYSVINEVIGVLECCKLELYRQVAAPYENIKKAENGNISGLDK